MPAHGTMFDDNQLYTSMAAEVWFQGIRQKGIQMIGQSAEAIEPMKKPPNFDKKAMRIPFLSRRILFSPVVATLLAVGCWTRAAIGEDFNQYRVDEARVKAIAANPKAIGTKEIEFLVTHLYFHESVQALSDAGTDEARAALWRIALGGGTSTPRVYLLLSSLTRRKPSSCSPQRTLRCKPLPCAA
jgi:hypothetical protein